MVAPTARRRRLSAPERREQILDAARELVATEGFHPISIEAVARRSGITRPVVYEHFGDLEGLLEALIEREEGRALGALAEILPLDLAGGDPRELLVGAFEAYLGVVRADPIGWTLVLMPAEGAPAALRERIAAGRAAVIGALAAAIAEAGGADPSSPDPELSARMLSAVADEAARLTITGPDEYPVARLVAHARWVLGRFDG